MKTNYFFIKRFLISFFFRNEQIIGDMNFFVDGEMVHVTEIKSSENFIGPLLDGIKKLDDVVKHNKRA